MTDFAPFARIALRYGVGLTLGAEMGDILAGDPDAVAAVALLIGLAVEAAYGFAKRKGWAT